MVLSVLGSSSSGNAYVLQNVGEALLIEAGVNFKLLAVLFPTNTATTPGELTRY